MSWSFGDAVANREHVQSLTANYEKLKKDIDAGKVADAAKDYANLGPSASSSNYYLQKAFEGISGAVDAWAKSISMNGFLLNNSVSGTGQGAKGDLKAPLLNEQGKPITLYDILNNPDQKCHMNLPEFDYNYAGGPYGDSTHGTLIIDGKTVNVSTATKDVDLVGPLNSAFNGAFTWTDRSSAHYQFQLTATGKLSDFINHANPQFGSAPGNVVNDLDKSFANLGL